MAYGCKILLDSEGPGGRLTTFEISYQRWVHSERLRHRALSCNVASSRARPITKVLEDVRTDPAIPIYWGKNQSGMQAMVELEGEELEAAKVEWLAARDSAVAHAERLLELKLHKQLTNRIIEPFVWVTEIISGTDWANFFALRCHPDAQPEIKHIAELMLKVYRESVPNKVEAGYWHTPLIDEQTEKDIEEYIDSHLDEYDERVKHYPEIRAVVATDLRLKISAGRCARVSYLTHDGKRDILEDIKLSQRLAESKHFSPFEHQAQALEYRHLVCANYKGWKQYRSLLPKNCLDWEDVHDN